MRKIKLQRKEILKYIIEKGLQASIPSVRVDACDKELLELIKKCGQKSLTIAPEAHQELRYKLNKHIPDKIYVDFMKLAQEAGFKKIKTYILIGNQTKQDIDKTVNFVKELKSNFKGKIYLSINPIVPKPTTALEKTTFDKKELKNQINYMKKQLKPINIDYKFNTLKYSYLEWYYANLETPLP